MVRRRLSRSAITLGALVLPASLLAQGPRPYARASAQAILAYTHVDHIPGGEALREVRVVQPVVMFDVGAWNGLVRLHATADFEGWTMKDGELAPGAWGEGFIDRRHPHTYVHELIFSGVDLLGHFDGSAVVSLSAGKGFVPFGTDDPMSRPTFRYPVNHHLSQMLERAVTIAAVRAGPVLAEGALFNGDEPTRPGQHPRWDRFADSWAGRLTVSPITGLELQGSYAKVKSPEHRPGAGPTQRKWNLSARWQGMALGAPAYVLIERARTSEIQGFFVYHSVLGELQWSPGRHRGWYRFERTERPEESRTLNLFRSVRPHLDNSIIGVTRWTIHTLGYGLTVATVSGVRLEPFGEASWAKVFRVGNGLFDPQPFYGSNSIWAVNLGLRVDWGVRGHRMGRYGAAEGVGHHLGMVM